MWHAGWLNACIARVSACSAWLVQGLTQGEAHKCIRCAVLAAKHVMAAPPAGIVLHTQVQASASAAGSAAEGLSRRTPTCILPRSALQTATIRVQGVRTSPPCTRGPATAHLHAARPVSQAQPLTFVTMPPFVPPTWMRSWAVHSS